MSRSSASTKQERLIRKRTAARIRQQRCRARKKEQAAEMRTTKINNKVVACGSPALDIHKSTWNQNLPLTPRPMEPITSRSPPRHHPYVTPTQNTRDSTQAHEWNSISPSTYLTPLQQRDLNYPSSSILITGNMNATKNILPPSRTSEESRFRDVYFTQESNTNPVMHITPTPANHNSHWTDTPIHRRESQNESDAHREAVNAILSLKYADNPKRRKFPMPSINAMRGNYHANSSPYPSNPVTFSTWTGSDTREDTNALFPSNILSRSFTLEMRRPIFPGSYDHYEHP
mmetsp:Transcript_36772/g.54021  ORF Transcript_36772/g.54021 Transcript_36772/m.54021 type:complete len:288 (+) Transcript_36772:104-967(+)